MGLTRKKFILDKKFQFGISINAIILPLITIIFISGILIYLFKVNDELIKINNDYSNEIINTQDKMIEMFLSVPALQNNENEVIRDGVSTFKKNIGKLKKINSNNLTIKENSNLFFKVLIVLTLIQTIVIFLFFIFVSHKITGPIHVMTQYLEKIQNNESPGFRPLRKNDQFIEFHNKFIETFKKLNIK